MSNYTKATNFATKDTLPTGNSGKIVKGTEIDDEFNAIASAISSKADTASPTFTGTPLAPTATAGSNTTQIATTAYVKNEVDDVIATLGTLSTQDKTSVDIEGGTIDGVTIGGTTAGAITGTTVTASTGFVGNLTGNVTGTVSGNAGTVTNGVYTTNFTSTNQSLATDGYQKLPGGLILQWCVGSASSSETTQTINFPITFPNAVLNVQASTYEGSSGADRMVQIRSFSTSSTVVYLNGIGGAGGNITPYIFAIGY